MPIRGPARGPAPAPARIPVPGRAPAAIGPRRDRTGLAPDRMPASAVARTGQRPGSAPAPMRGSGRGPGTTARPRPGRDRAPAPGHGQTPAAIPGHPGPPLGRGLHGHPERGARPAIQVPALASAAPAGTAAPEHPVPHGRAAGAPNPAWTRRAPTCTHRCRTRSPAPGVAAATGPARARMTAARRKRRRGEPVRVAVAGGAASRSRRPRPTVRPRWAAMSCWTALRRRAAAPPPAGACHPGRPWHPDRPYRRARTRRRAAARPTAAHSQAGPPGAGVLLAGTKPPSRHRMRTSRRRRPSSRSRTVPGWAGEGHAAGAGTGRQPRIPWRPGNRPDADPGPPGPDPGPASAGPGPWCWPSWWSWFSRPGRWPR